MIEDIVINSYKEQIKQSILKAEAVKVAGFDLIIGELNKRSIKTDKVMTFFNKIRNSSTKEEIDNLTVDELNEIIDDINLQITKALISSVEVAELLVRKSRIIAKEKSPNGKINDNDNYVKVGTNLASEVNKHGIAHGLNICIKNYCIQKLYQATYREKIREKEKELGILVSDEKNKTSSPVIVNTKKSKTMIELFGKNINEDIDTFEVVKKNYIDKLNNEVNNIENYR